MMKRAFAATAILFLCGCPSDHKAATKAGIDVYVLFTGTETLTFAGGNKNGAVKRVDLPIVSAHQVRNPVNEQPDQIPDHTPFIIVSDVYTPQSDLKPDAPKHKSQVWFLSVQPDTQMILDNPREAQTELDPPPHYDCWGASNTRLIGVPHITDVINGDCRSSMVDRCYEKDSEVPAVWINTTGGNFTSYIAAPVSFEFRPFSVGGAPPQPLAQLVAWRIAADPVIDEHGQSVIRFSFGGHTLALHPVDGRVVMTLGNAPKDDVLKTLPDEPSVAAAEPPMLGLHAGSPNDHDFHFDVYYDHFTEVYVRRQPFVGQPCKTAFDPQLPPFFQPWSDKKGNALMSGMHCGPDGLP